MSPPQADYWLSALFQGRHGNCPGDSQMFATASLDKLSVSVSYTFWKQQGQSNSEVTRRRQVNWSQLWNNLVTTLKQFANPERWPHVKLLRVSFPNNPRCWPLCCSSARFKVQAPAVIAGPRKHYKLSSTNTRTKAVVNRSNLEARYFRASLGFQGWILQ